VVHEDSLSAVLSDFARTMITDFPIQGIVDHLVERIVEILPVTSAGVSLISAGTAPRYIAASDQNALRFERLQSSIGEGPCLSAFESGTAVSVADLRTDDRFPHFASAALADGLTAVFSFPLRHGEGRLGALDLYRGTAGDLDPHTMEVAQTLADVAAAYLLNAQAREEAREASDRFHHNAQHDPLTGLPNRLMLQHRLEHAALRAQRSNTNAAILFADLDRFKQVNDTYGHPVGDELLLAVARRLAGLVRPGDTLARVSGDEFVFLCEDLHSPDDVEVLARRIDKAFSRPFLLSSVELSITASVGVAFAGPGEDISNQLVVQADTAMYQAKRKGGAGHQIIDLREAVKTHERDSLEMDLRAAIGMNELDVCYQPIVWSADGRVTGVEALVRWTHPTRGAVPAVSLVDIAERSGLISDIGVWVLERSCLDRGGWLRDHPGAPLDLAVNVSARQLANPDFVRTVGSVLERTDMDPRALVLEVTENIFIEDTERAMTVLAELKQFGIRLALDDFGTGYSSLSYLRRLPIHIVKIDQSFIADIGSHPEGSAIVAAVTELAHVLGLAVTAEGVETQIQRDQVSAIGCEFSQGYYYSRPMPAEAIAAQLGGITEGPLHLPTPRGSVDVGSMTSR
jgi:diguanylate cyclase (GGDEF)-like protein